MAIVEVNIGAEDLLFKRLRDRFGVAKFGHVQEVIRNGRITDVTMNMDYSGTTRLGRTQLTITIEL